MSIDVEDLNLFYRVDLFYNKTFFHQNALNYCYLFYDVLTIYNDPGLFDSNQTDMR